MATVAGIDPGLTGGVCIKNNDSGAWKPVYWGMMPLKRNGKRVDDQELERLLVYYGLAKDSVVCVEDPFILSTQKGNKTIVENYSRILVAVERACQNDDALALVEPKIWQAILLSNIPDGLVAHYHKANQNITKARAIWLAINDGWDPYERVSGNSVDLNSPPVPRSVRKDGLADAYCLSVYAGMIYERRL